MAATSSTLLLFFFLLQTLTLGSGTVAVYKKTYIFRINHLMKPSIFPTHEHWYTSPSFGVSTLHIYSTVFHGFSASLTAERAAALGNHPAVLAVFQDRLRYVHTTRSPQFLGLRNKQGLWSDSDYGAEVIVGILDTGVWPERRSFSDRNIGPVPSRWRGTCETGENFPGSICNRKLVGARFFSRGHDASADAAGGIGGINETVEFRSPRDADGHGTHTASTAAGRHVFGASLSGYASGIAKGVAPKARVAVYKVCWKGSGCLDSDILAGFDSAVADGVDVISISIGGGDGISAPYYLDPIAVGAFGAVSKGVFVASSAGNDGPTAMSVTNLAPWLTTVGAGTIDRTFPADIVLGDGRRLSGVSLYSGPAIDGQMYPLVYPGKSGGLPASLCMENSLDPKLVKGTIVVCDRGSSPRVAKGLVVKNAGGVGMILANGISNGEGLVGDAHVLPACAVGSDEGDSVKSYITANANPTATLAFRGTIIGVKPAPVVASFSGRGPNGLTPEVLKPDLIAPGVNILAAWTDAVGPTGLDSDHRKTEFNILSGTSMACPHVSGAAALLKSAHPSWSPAAIRSAMMTSSNLVDNTLQPVTDEGTGEPVTPLDIGAGHLNLYKAMDPGLVYDMGYADYVTFLCALEYEPKMIQIITHSPVTCPAKRPQPENLNYPSIMVVFEGAASVNQSKTVVRTVTNVEAAGSGVYKAKVSMVSGKGLAVSVKPGKLVFSPAVNKQSFAVTVTVTAVTAAGDPGSAPAADYGYLTWSDGTHEVRSPIVVSRIQPL
ncbi:subtilisin-like protease SBT1.6 [Dendrobium catenatum]|uniref:Subtilisin-like protease n=1 Tax=Dendrobium catenatum TaxID=906689 RepID=A0A2I0VME6_9ASPA|nr:subtilisin-like protease SBT1.6 [Dendrobium catenatum]PKU64577.1 Subtilisin-like protease [Dendrobium catenatum]